VQGFTIVKGRSGIDSRGTLHYIDHMQYRTNLREHRLRIGLSQQEVADAALIHRNTYLDYESGERVPQLNIARRIAAVLGCTTAELWPPITEDLDAAS
jgi:DNA-binding XRE family transcriptional regulator